MNIYEEFLEDEMKVFYLSLPEDKRRLYAAIESDKIGNGGVQYISNLFSCSSATIIKGKRELEEEREKKSQKFL